MAVISFEDGVWRAPETNLVIVGAGAAGIVLAVSLARAGVPVTLVEAGPREPPHDYSRYNTGPSTGRPFFRMDIGRMRAFGGTTRLWGGQLVAFDRSDLESRDADGRRLWPISYDEFAPWIGEAFRLLGQPLSAADLPKLYEATSGEPTALSTHVEAFLTAWLPQPDFTRLFERDLASNPNLTVVTDASVSQLRLSGADAVEAVEITNPAGETHTLGPARLVLAAGTFEIAKILIQAARGNPGTSLAANRHIGRWYLDHLNGVIGEIEVTNRTRFAHHFGKIFADGRKYMVKLRGRAPRQAGSANIAVAFLDRVTVRDLISDCRQLLGRAVRWQGNPLKTIRDAARILRAITPFAWLYIRSRRAGYFGNRLPIGLELEQLPEQESYLFVEHSQDGGVARTGVHWNVGLKEIQSVREFALNLKNALEENDMGYVTLNPRVEAGDPSFFDECQNSGHYMGGARMAEGAEQGVVDRNCMVFGTTNLYIAGAAVFPSGSFANSTLSALALALRLGRHLQETGR